MTWTFPISPLIQSTPTIETLRQITCQVFADLTERLRQDDCPLTLGPAALKADGSHWHPMPELFVQLSGRSRFITPLGKLELSAGSCLLIPPLLDHEEFVVSGADPFANLVIFFRDGRLSYHLALLSKHLPRKPSAVLPDLIENPCLTAGEACLNAILDAAEDPSTQIGCFHAVCVLASRALAQAPAPGTLGSHRISRVKEIIQGRLSSAHLTIGQLATWTACHPDHLTRLFRAETGETLIAYIQRQRLERAKTLMADPRLRIRDVARLVGINDPAYFSRVWRKAFGKSPSDRGRTPETYPGKRS